MKGKSHEMMRMQATRVWMIVAVIGGLVLSGAGTPRTALAATTFSPLPVSALSPGDGQIALTSAPVQVQLDTSSAAWPVLKGQFQSGNFGLRLAWSGHVEWFVPKSLTAATGSLAVSNAISFDKSSGVVTAHPTLALGTDYSVTLAVGTALIALVVQDLGRTVSSSTSLCCASSWGFQTATSLAIAQSQSGPNPTVSVAFDSSTLIATASGSGTLNVALYLSNPVSSAAGTLPPSTSYSDVSAALGSNFSTVTLTQSGLSAPETAYWRNGQTWQRVSAQSYSNGTLSITLNASSSSPTIAQLTGTVLATVPPPAVSGATPSSAPSSGGTSVTITGSGFTGATSVCFGVTCTSGFSVLSDTQISITAPGGTPGATVDVTVTTPGGTSPTSSGDQFLYTVSDNILTNGDFSSGMAGWTPACNTWGGSGGGSLPCGSFTSTSSTGLTLDMASANAPYAGVYQTIPVPSANLTLSGTVTVNRMDECADNAAWIYVTPLDANQQPLGSSLDGLTLTGNIQYGHHPYLGCTTSGWTSKSSAYYQDMPAWTAIPGAQNFTMPIGSIIAQRLSGIDATKVAYVRVQLEAYADTATPSVTFSSLILNAVPIVNVKTLGAAGDGVTNDTQVFQTALSRLSYDGGGILIVPSGNYLVDPGALTVKSNITIDGYGAALEPASPGYQLLDLQGSNITLAGVTLEGNNNVVRGMSVEAGSAGVILTHDTIQDVTQPTDSTSALYMAMPVGIQVYGNTSAIQVDSSTVNNVVAVRPECSSCTPAARGILITAVSGQTIGQNIKIEASTLGHVAPKDDGDCLVAQNASTAANLVIYHNSFDFCAKRAIKLQAPGVLIADNTIDNPFLGDNAGLGPAYSYANFPYDMYSAISVYSSNVTVTGNTISGVGSFYNAIEIGDVCSTLSNITVQNNSVSMGPKSYLAGDSLIRAMGPVTSLTITGNQGSYANSGIMVPPNLGAQIGSNTFTNVTTQINYYQAPC